MKSRAFHTVTLGCKLNQFDTAAIEGELAARGYEESSAADAASIVIVNTCTVTHRADADARKLIRRIRRRNSDAQLWVTGCYAEREPELLRAIPGVDRVFGNREKHRVGEFLDAKDADPDLKDLDRSRRGPEGDRGCGGALSAPLQAPAALHFGARTRAFLRIQDGCRLACSYCIIPTVRGTSRSVPVENVLRSARHLWNQGYREIVLTGVNSGDWGRDLEPRSNLQSLLREMLVHAGDNRLRLNSLEPLTISEDLIALMAEDSRLAPHLQVPLQSGSPKILQAMRRNYRREAYLDRLARLRESIPHVGLGADVIVGFPGETETCFQETYDFIAASPLNYLHVFSWSPRPGTPAAERPGRVPEREIQLRNRALRELAAEHSVRFRQGQLGQVRQALVLEPKTDSQRLRALTDNFFEVTLPKESARPGELVRVILTEVHGDATSASIA